MCSFSHLHPYNILQAHEGEKEMEAGAGFLHVTDTANRLVFFFSPSSRPSGCCISHRRKFQDPSPVITDSNSYVCPDETIFLGIFLLVLLNMSFYLPLLAPLQHKAVGILLNEDINFSRLLQTPRLLKKINCYCFCTAPFFGKMKNEKNTATVSVLHTSLLGEQ